MANGTNTYTSYLRTQLDPVTEQSYSRLRTIAAETYRDIGNMAAQAAGATATAFSDRRAAEGIRSLERASTGAFSTIRRDAAATSSAVSSLQQQLSAVRTTAFASAAGVGGNVGTAGTRTATAANDNLAASTRRVTAATEASTLAHRRYQIATGTAANDTGRLSRSLTVLGTTLSVVQGPLGPIAGRINAITAAVTTLGTGTLVLAGAATALFAFAGVANVYAEVESRLKPLYSSQQQVNSAMRETGRIALATRASLGTTVDLYAKLTAAGRDYGFTSRQISRVTETASKAATLSGGNAATREAGLYQFSQGIASGRLGGDELRSVLENIPELARAIASGFKNADGSIGTTIGTLRKLGSEGKLSAQAVVDALGRSAVEIDAKFSKLPKTISSARTEFITSFTLMTGQIDQTIGVTSTLAEAISVAARNLQLLMALGGAMAARFVLPKLAGFINELMVARGLQRQLASETALAAGRLGGGTVSLLTPTGIAEAKAVSATNDARANANASAARVAAQRQVVTAIDQEIVATRAAMEADREKTRAAVANSRFQTAAAEQRLVALKAEFEQTAATRAAAATRVDTLTRAAPLVNRPLGAGETDETRTARITAFTQQQRAAKLELAQADLRAAAAARALAAAETELTVAMQAEAAATTTSANAANNNARRGFALLGLAQQRAVAAQGVTAATLEQVAADNALAAAETRLTAAQRAAAAASALTVRALNGLKGAANALITAMGGPGIAVLTVFAGALIYLASQSNAALDALHNFAGGQEELQRRLGLTTDKLREQSEAARSLALSLAQANVVKAQTARVDANADLGKSLVSAAQQLAPGGSLGVGRLFEGGQQGKDIDTLLRLGRALQNGGAIGGAGIAEINAIQKRNPGAFQTSGINRALLNLQGARPDDTADKLLGAEGARLTLKDAQKTLEETKAELAKPRVTPKPVVPLTPAQIVAQGEAAARDEYNNPRATALRKYNEAKERALADKNDTEQEKADKIRDAKAAYDAQILSLDRRDAKASKAIAAKAAREHEKAERAAARAAAEAATNTERLADVRARYDEAPRLVDQVRNDQRAFEALIGENINVTGPDGKVTRRAYTRGEAERDQAKAQEALNKPFNDMTRDMERQLQIQTLQLQGREAEAEALSRSFQLIDRTGSLESGQYQTLVALADQQNQINAALEERGRIVGTLRGVVDDMRQSLTQFLDDLPRKAGEIGKTFRDSSGRERKYGTGDFLKDAAGGLGGQLLGNFNSAANSLGIGGLFAGAQKKIDDLISGRTGLQSATEFTASQTMRTGTAVQRFGDVVAGVTARVEATLSSMAGPAPVAGQNLFPGANLIVPAVSAAMPIDELSRDIDRLGDRLAGRGSLVSQQTEGEDQEVVVTARARPKTTRPAQPTQPVTLREVYNETGRSIGEKIDNALGTKFAKNLGGSLGDALSGARTGSFVSTAANALGIKMNGTGASIGGAIGGVLPIPGGEIIGSIAGGLLGNLFTKPKSGSAVLTSVNAPATLAGNKQVTEGLSGTAKSVQEGLQRIADSLGAEVGNFNVSIGKREDYYRVSATGASNVGAKHPGAVIYDGKDEAAAIEIAIRDALSDGAIKGISAASQRILQSGQDLQKAITKALLIEAVPKKLLAATDPVRAAVEDLNRQYTQLIAALNEGGATAQQFADAQKLYDIERAKAIAEARKQAVGAIESYLKDLNAGSNSPLNKATVYGNAKSDFEKLAADVRAGKLVDQQDLVAAGQKFDAASGALNGRGQAYFSDFDALNKILNQAVKNGGVIDSSGASDLPGSPFGKSVLENALAQSTNATVQATNNQTDVLGEKLDRLNENLGRLSGGGGGEYRDGRGYSSLDNLAAFREF